MKWEIFLWLGCAATVMAVLSIIAVICLVWNSDAEDTNPFPLDEGDTLNADAKQRLRVAYLVQVVKANPSRSSSETLVDLTPVPTIQQLAPLYRD